MINAFLEKIRGVFDKDFWVGSYFASLVFFLNLLIIASFVLGFRNVLLLVFDGYGDHTLQIGVCVALLTFLFAYTLFALRHPILCFWSGKYDLYVLKWFVRSRKNLKRRHFLQKREEIDKVSMWSELEAKLYGWEFKKDIQSISEKKKAELLTSIDRDFNMDLSLADAEKTLERYKMEYQAHAGESMTSIFNKLLRRFQDFDEEVRVAQQLQISQLDVRYGLLSTIEATRLGNIVEAYNQYPFKRYGIESEIFWPRLQRVIHSDYVKLIQEQRIQLDFFLSISSVLWMIAVLCFFVGPCFHTGLALWWSLTVVYLILGYMFYSFSISSALSLGHYIRACFDLFRTNLLKELSLKKPGSFKEEIAIWTSFSRLVVYGQTELMEFNYDENKDATI